MDTTFFNAYSDLEYEEIILIEDALKNFSEEDKQRFLMIYRSRRQDPTNMLIFILLGFFGVAGIHRFVIGDIALGILYLLTAGFCWIGTIVDLVNYKTITLNHNRQKIMEVLAMMRFRTGNNS